MRIEARTAAWAVQAHALLVAVDVDVDVDVDGDGDGDGLCLTPVPGVRADASLDRTTVPTPDGTVVAPPCVVRAAEAAPPARRLRGPRASPRAG